MRVSAIAFKTERADFSARGFSEIKDVDDSEDFVESSSVELGIMQLLATLRCGCRTN